MNKKFVWTIKHTKFCCLLGALMLIISLFTNNDTLISYSITTAYACICGLFGHIMRIKSGIKDDKNALTRKQALFVFSLFVLVVLSIIAIESNVVDKSSSFILVFSLVLVSGIFVSVYMSKAIKKNKRNE